MPARNRSRSYSSWPTLRPAKAHAMTSEADLSKRIPESSTNSAKARLSDFAWLTAEARGALPLWQKTEMI